MWPVSVFLTLAFGTMYLTASYSSVYLYVISSLITLQEIKICNWWWWWWWHQWCL